jgi:hypothetical protein
MDTKLARVITAQMEVAKNLAKDPVRTLKFMLDNKEYFNNADQWIEMIRTEMRDKGTPITDEQLEQCPTVKLAPLDTETRHFDKMQEDAAKVNAQRPFDYLKRDHGGKRGTTPKEPGNFYISKKAEEQEEQEQEDSIV